MTLAGKTMFISGASRGIGLAIAKRAAADGANIALVAKTAEPHPKLEGTIYTAAKEIEEAGGQALPIVGDVRDGDSVAAAVAKAVEQFGGIDICVNNASAINLGSIEEVPLKRFDLMNGIQVRGTYAVSQACIPHMKGRQNPHILTLSPPLRLEPQWLEPTPYMMAKFGMTLCALGIAEEMRQDGNRVEHAVAAHHGGDRGGAEPAGRRRGDGALTQARRLRRRRLRDPEQAGREYTGNTLLCEDVLLESGVTDLSVYDCVPGSDLGVDLWVDRQSAGLPRALISARMGPVAFGIEADLPSSSRSSSSRSSRCHSSYPSSSSRSIDRYASRRRASRRASGRPGVWWSSRSSKLSPTIVVAGSGRTSRRGTGSVVPVVVVPVVVVPVVVCRSS